MPRLTNKLFIALAVTLVAGLAAAPMSLAGPSSEVVVVSHDVEGTTVQVTLYNAGSGAATVYVQVDATVRGTPSRSMTAVSVLGHKTATVNVGFPGEVTDVIAVGIADGDSPFPN